MTDEREVTARELAQHLEKDEAYNAHLTSQRERAVGLHAATQDLLNLLAARGYQAGTWEELVGLQARDPDLFATLLLASLTLTSDPLLQETMVRALGSARTDLDVEPLVRLFEATDSQSLRWAIANTLAEMRPRGIQEWLLRAVREPSFGAAREMLALAVARVCPPATANPVLTELLNVIPGHAALALAACGGKAELQQLEARLATAKGWVRKEIVRAIKAIRKRL